MSRHVTRLLAVLVPAALLLPAAAHAQEAVFDDAATDAKAINMGAAFGDLAFGTTAEGPPFLDAPAETSTDIVRTTIDHASKRLTLTVQVRDLVDTEEHSIEFRIITPEGRFSLSAGMTTDGAVAYLSPARSGVVVVDGDVQVAPSSKPCRTVRARYDLAADTVVASVPTACLGTPNWVQVAAVASRFKVTPLGDGSVNLAGYADDAFRGGLSVHSMGRSPKVRRG